MTKFGTVWGGVTIGAVGLFSWIGAAVNTGSVAADSVLVVRSASGADTALVAVDAALGGAIVEVSWDHINPVNRYDAGREIQLALYDGNQKYDFKDFGKAFGWDPVQAGDKHHHTRPLLSQSWDSTSVYTKAQPPEWFPDNKGGGVDSAIVTDVYIEQRVSPVLGFEGTFQVHYTITHLGSDEHDNSFQEVPAVYVNKEFHRFVYYSGLRPWTLDSATTLNLPENPATFAAIPTSPTGATLYMSEHWGSLVNDDGVGITVYTPGQYPYGIVRSYPGTGGATGSGTQYYRPLTYFTVPPHGVVQADVYLIAGTAQAARKVIYRLKAAGIAPDQAAPVGYLDNPKDGTALTGAISIAGWAMDNVSVAKIGVYVDGKDTGTATYGSLRPDVAREYPYASPKIGFKYQLETARVSNGKHVLQVRIVDSTGNAAWLPPVSVTIHN
jgi:hypothetical protein